MELARGEVGELVAADFFEESVFGFLEEGGEADEAALGIAMERKHVAQFKVVFDAIRELMKPALSSNRRIGFQPDDESRSRLASSRCPIVLSFSYCRWKSRSGSCANGRMDSIRDGAIDRPTHGARFIPTLANERWYHWRLHYLSRAVSHGRQLAVTKDDLQRCDRADGT